MNDKLLVIILYVIMFFLFIIGRLIKRNTRKNLKVGKFYNEYIGDTITGDVVITNLKKDKNGILQVTYKDGDKFRTIDSYTFTEIYDEHKF